MTIVCLLAGLCKFYWSDLHEKIKRDLVQVISHLNFKSDPDHRLNTKKHINDPDFRIYLLLTMYMQNRACIDGDMHSLSALV